MSTAALIAALLSIDPEGLGGVWLRARHGPQSGALISALQSAGSPTIVRPGMDPAALFGGLDLTRSLTSGKIFETQGAFQDGRAFHIAQAERLDQGLASQMAARFDGLKSASLVLLDEGADEDPLPPAILRDRLAFFLHEGSAPGQRIDTGTAADRVGSVSLPDSVMADAVIAAARLGVQGLRPVLQTVAAARAHAALCERSTVSSEDLEIAAQLVLGHRAMQAPEQQDDPLEQSPSAESQGDSSSESGENALPQDLVVDAAQTALPTGVLAALAIRSKLANGAGAGLVRKSDTRGRPLPARPGRLDGRKRIDLLATLNAAAPWQRTRGASGLLLKIRSEDVRVKRYRDRSERLLIFAVDASGSAAMARLAEAKGAAEQLLAAAYENRDMVCLSVFRDRAAEVIVPPTRSLTRAKRLLSALPAGGATPLAAGLQLAADLADRSRRAGQMPQVVLMTDGRPNRALDGSTNRSVAEKDTDSAAQRLKLSSTPVVILDSGRRKTRHLTDLAGRLGAEIVPLPRLGASLSHETAGA